MLKAVVFDEFSSQCPYFYSYEKEFINNYYNCKHLNQEEVEKAESGEKIGKCYCFSCPLGMEATQDDLLDREIDWDGLCEEGEVYEGEYLLVEVGENATNEQKEAMRNYELYVHRYDKKWLDEHGIKNSLCD